MPETFNISAPIQPHDANVSAYELRNRTDAMDAALSRVRDMSGSVQTRLAQVI